MFGVLLESRAKRQRRTGGAMLSAASHLAIVGGVAVFTTRGPAHAAPPEKPRVYKIALQTEPPPPTHARIASGASQSPSAFVVPSTRVIDVPVITPVGLPSIQPATGLSLDNVSLGGTPGGLKRGLTLTDSDGDGGGEWRGSELLMRIVEQSKPRYPETLRQAGIDGTVLLRFTVDTLGRVDPASVAVLQSTHDLFANAARAALLGFRFRPAEVNGRRVSALAEMPFEFKVR